MGCSHSLANEESHICSWRTQAHCFPGSRTEAPMAASKLPHGHTPQDLCTLTLVQVWEKHLQDFSWCTWVFFLCPGIRGGAGPCILCGTLWLQVGLGLQIEIKIWISCHQWNFMSANKQWYISTLWKYWKTREWRVVPTPKLLSCPYLKTLWLECVFFSCPLFLLSRNSVLPLMTACQALCLFPWALNHVKFPCSIWKMFLVTHWYGQVPGRICVSRVLKSPLAVTPPGFLCREEGRRPIEAEFKCNGGKTLLLYFVDSSIFSFPLKVVLQYLVISCCTCSHVVHSKLRQQMMEILWVFVLCPLIVSIDWN